jgi:hypothetical protein
MGVRVDVPMQSQTASWVSVRSGRSTSMDTTPIAHTYTLRDRARLDDRRLLVTGSRGCEHPEEMQGYARNAIVCNLLITKDLVFHKFTMYRFTDILEL